ncbi:MAG: hypothetical protein ACKN9T_19480 [Candidatus Methylumidiphilus sp.]
MHGLLELDYKGDQHLRIIPLSAIDELQARLQNVMLLCQPP